jgi:hypothetical protein
MKQFELLLKNEKKKSYQRITWLIIVSNIAILILLSIKGIFSKGEVIAIVIMIGLAVFIPFYVKSKDVKIETSIIFIILMTVWISTGYWWVAIINFVFEIFQIAALRNLIVRVKPDTVIYPSFPQRQIDWKELSNLILKDGLLTIDFKNNKIIQQYVDQKSLTIDEKEFNDFCRQQLNK